VFQKNMQFHKQGRIEPSWKSDRLYKGWRGEGSQMKDWPIRTRYRKKWALRHAVGTVDPERGKNSRIRDPENFVFKGLFGWPRPENAVSSEGLFCIPSS
jgi:hypothetical protein